jgi:hypothetical protein
MKKKYLKTIEDIEAFRNTNTKIYSSLDESKPETFYRFVNGVLCFFWDENNYSYNAFLQSNENARPYIIVEEPVKELTGKDRGMLCKFMKSNQKRIGILACFTNTKKPVAVGGEIFDKCCRLTPAEVAEITGYKVEE